MTCKLVEPTTYLKLPLKNRPDSQNCKDENLSNKSFVYDKPRVDFLVYKVVFISAISIVVFKLYHDGLGFYDSDR